MKCLSIRQPYAAAILAGIKTTEYRSWSTRYRGPLLIHAPLSVATDTGFEDAFPDVHDLPRGAIVGLADLVAIGREEHDTPEGPAVGFAWQLANPRAFAQPVAFTGRLGLFEVPIGMLGAEARAEVLP